MSGQSDQAKGLSTTSQIIFSQVTDSAGDPAWIIQDWLAGGTLNTNVAGISCNASGRIRYQLKNNLYNYHTTYSITSGTVSLTSAATANLFSGSATALPTPQAALVLKQITAADGSSSWQTQAWRATGTLNLSTAGISANAAGTIAYQLANASYGVRGDFQERCRRLAPIQAA